MKVKVPFKVTQVDVPLNSGQAAGIRMVVTPIRFCKHVFLDEVTPRFGHCYNVKDGQHVGWLNYYRGIWFWRSAK